MELFRSKPTGEAKDSNNSNKSDAPKICLQGIYAQKRNPDLLLGKNHVPQKLRRETIRGT